MLKAFFYAAILGVWRFRVELSVGCIGCLCLWFMRRSRGTQGPAMSPAERKAALAQQLQKIDRALAEMGGCAGGYAATATPVAADTPANTNGTRASVNVVVANSKMAAVDPSLISNVTAMVNEAYGYRRVDEDDIQERFAMGDPGSSRGNRVLHVAFQGDRPVGCMSSTFSVPWAEDGCGHWGLLVVDVNFQGKGVASAMVTAAETRLAGACEEIQIEYEHTPGEVLSERLLAWYEGKCGFRCLSGPPRGRGREFRKCRKPIPEEAQRTGQRLRLLNLREDFAADLAALEGDDSTGAGMVAM